jgi:hypothetical protein
VGSDWKPPTGQDVRVGQSEPDGELPSVTASGPGAAVLDIPGFGPVTVRALSESEYREIQREHGGDHALGVALVIQRGVVEPEFARLAKLEGNDDAINAIANAIIDLTRSNIL